VSHTIFAEYPMLGDQQQHNDLLLADNTTDHVCLFSVAALDLSGVEQQWQSAGNSSSNNNDNGNNDDKFMMIVIMVMIIISRSAVQMPLVAMLISCCTNLKTLLMLFATSDTQTAESMNV